MNKFGTSYEFETEAGARVMHVIVSSYNVEDCSALASLKPERSQIPIRNYILLAFSSQMYIFES